MAEMLGFKWSGKEDSNLRPLPPEDDAPHGIQRFLAVFRASQVSPDGTFSRLVPPMRFKPWLQPLSIGFGTAVLGPPMFADEEPSEEEFSLECRLAPSSPEAKYTYFFVLADQPFVKIGRSNDPFRRRMEIQLEVGSIKQVATMRGNFERRYQEAFAAHRLGPRSEYFHAHPDILGEVARLIAWEEVSAKARPA